MEKNQLKNIDFDELVSLTNKEIHQNLQDENYASFVSEMIGYYSLSLISFFTFAAAIMAK